MKSIFSINDHHGTIIEIQASLANGLPTLQIIGMASKSVDEAKERVRSALSASSIPLPRKKITCNLSPADVPKIGAHYDLAIAFSILLEAGMIRPFEQKTIVIGELALDGSLKPARGILGKIQEARSRGFRHFIIPSENVKQALLLPDIYIHAANNLAAVVQAINTQALTFTNTANGTFSVEQNNANVFPDIADVVGQTAAKRALTIAAAGHHNILLSGPPGVGKSMLAKTMLGILPELTREETITITQIHSLVGAAGDELIQQRPLRAPHHSTSDIALIGGGTKPKPGEVSLSHGGILFLDEIPEFKRSALESLRQPLEDRSVTVSRAQERITYPADFILVATKNPCPCGFWGSTRPCICSPIELDRYQKKLSGPLLDRIDLHVTVDSIDHTKLLTGERTHTTDSSVNSATIRTLVGRAINRQQKRFNKSAHYNGTMSNAEIKQFARLEPTAKDLLDTAASRLEISARVYMKIVKIARTIADLEDSEKITTQHVSEALRYRPVVIS